jgi:hypothetical protein
MSQAIVLDLTASFVDVSSPTPFGLYDADAQFQTAANGMVTLVNVNLGGSILDVELTNKDVYACLEQATLEYSALVNSYHAKSVLADIIGSPTGSLDGSENKVPRMDLALAKRRAAAYSSEAVVGGTKTLHSASIDLVVGQQNYDLQTLLSGSGELVGNERAELKEVFHLSPTAAYRFFDTTSAINYLHNEFSFESFTPETIFYLLPVWEDILRAQTLEVSHKVRRSNYSYNIVNNTIRLYPVPTREIKLYFTYFKVSATDDPFDSSQDPLADGVANLSNVPFGNIDYSKINSAGQHWIRRYALALSKEVLGYVRSKVSAIPIPNGDLTLNGPQLIDSGRQEQLALKDELRGMLDSMTYDTLAQQERDQAEALQDQLAKVPLGIFVG